MAATFAAREGSVKRVRSWRGQSPGFGRDWWNETVRLGWLGIMVPQSYGGAGLGLADMRVVVEELARSVVPEPVTACAGLACGALLHGDNESLKRELLPRIASGQLIAALAWQENDCAIDPTVIATRAVRQPTGELCSVGQNAS